jgi:hypothetical protein
MSKFHLKLVKIIEMLSAIGACYLPHVLLSATTNQDMTSILTSLANISPLLIDDAAFSAEVWSSTHDTFYCSRASIAGVSSIVSVVLQLYYVCTMYTMIYTVTIYILCTEVQYMVHTIVYIVNMDDVLSLVWGEYFVLVAI